jgi:hypothetical protein
MSKHILLLLTNPVEGREDEFNKWYDERHMPDVLNVPGIISGQRFELSSAQPMKAPYPWSYFAFYEIETGDIDSVVKEIVARSGTDLMPRGNAMKPERQAYILQAITDVISASALSEGAPTKALS